MTRSLFALIVIGLLMLACQPTPAAPAQTDAPPTVAVASTEVTKTGTLRLFDLSNADIRDIPATLAFEDLAAMGYVVERVAVDSSSLIAEAMVTGHADMGSLNVQTVWSAIGEGADVRTVVQQAANPLVLVSKREIETCADLDGRPVGVPNVTGMTPALLAEHIAQNCPEAEPNLVIISQTGGRLAALIAGEIDAALLQTEQLLRLERDSPGQFHSLAALGAEFSEVITGAFHVRREWGEANRELVQDFVRALLLRVRDVYDDPEAFYAMAAERLELEPEVVEEVTNAYLNQRLWQTNGGLTREKVQYNLDFLAEIEELSPGLTVDDVADLSYLDAVLAEIGTE